MPRRRDEQGTGLVDVLVGFFIFALLGVTAIAALTRVSAVTLAVQSDNQAAVLAHRLLAKANADGCGLATGYGMPTSEGAPGTSAVTTLYGACTWGSNDVHALADVPANLATPATSCTPAQGACYQVGPITDTAALSFSWAWSAADTAPSSCGAGAMAPPPDEVIATATIWWPNHHAGGYHQYHLTSIESVPPVIQSAWDAGGLGGIAVQAPAGTPVSLAPASAIWPGPITTTASAIGCAWFPYVPAAPLGTYSVTVNGVPKSVPAVAPNTWSAVSS